MTDRDDGIVITPELTIPRAELTFRATPGGGPGGQHVNRSATRVELWWNLRDSMSLNDAQRARLEERLAPRLDRQGRLRLVSGARRSLVRNREEAIARFARLLADALHEDPPRKKTRPSRAAREQRLTEKRRRGRRKQERRPPGEDD